jgi:hypothetical protein
MRRKRLSILALAVCAVALSGCSTLDFWKEDALGHYHRFRGQIHDMHRFVDRHFFDYNWDDPSLNY